MAQAASPLSLAPALSLEGTALGLSESEEEFLAEDELIHIVPNISMDALKLACGSVGPFRPQMAAQVPLWLALALKKRQKCSIQTPPWLSADHLSILLEEERSSEAFQPLPYHFIEMAELLFQADESGREIPDAYRVRTLIQDIKDVRQHKIEDGLRRLDRATQAVKLSNLTAMEVTLIRPFFCGTLTRLYKLDKASAAISDGPSGFPSSNEEAI